MDVQKKEELVQLLSNLVASLSDQEKKEVLEKILGKKEGIPISVFRSGVSGLEAIVMYLKDSKGLTISEIADILNRKRSTLYTTYQKARKKLSGQLDISDDSIIIPYHIFANRNFAVLESLVAYLKDEMKLSFVKISTLLNKKYSTVRTVYVRHQKKCQS
ncbi:MAG: sigma factor-like helix-turn-helix DNA-binding protein [Nanoarchaeota archaeon]|nr:sigma factor-like helix-turn-helix DNA-binding protein [Nanoarchaeota archaeon]